MTEKTLGTFSAEPLVRLLVHKGEDRRVRLEETLVYTNARGESAAVFKGRESDGGSIPRVLWWLIGSPLTGDYRRGCLVHDALCMDRGRWDLKIGFVPMSSAEVHAWLRDMVEADGCAPWRTPAIYRGVSWFGPRWEKQTITIDNGGE